jgi:NADH-quinone oxidoreductase subunit G
VIARDNPDVDDGWLCDRGRYGFEMFAAEERVTAPRLRGGPASWDEAIAKAAEALRTGASEIDHTRGGSISDASSGVAAIVGDASNEEGYLVQRILREALGSPHVESRAARGPSRDTLLRLARPELSIAVRDLDQADAILVVGADPLHSSPILDLRIRKAMRRKGARLALATDRPTALDGGAEAATRYAPGGATLFLSELAACLRLGTEHGAASAVADVLRKAERVVVVWGERIAREGEGAMTALLDVASALRLEGKEGSGLLEIPDLANARGLREAGCLPDAGPGLSQLAGLEGAGGEGGSAAGERAGAAGRQARVANDAPATGLDTERIRVGLESSKLKSLLLFGVDPLRDLPDTPAWQRALAAADHIVCFSTFENATTAMADVVFPLETHAEKDGTVTHPDGRLQRVRPSASRPGDIRPSWGVLAELSLALDHDTGVTSQPSAFAALAGAVPFYNGIDDAEIGGRGVRWQDRPAASSLSRATGDGSPGRRSPGVPGEPSPASGQSPAGAGELQIVPEGASGAGSPGTPRDSEPGDPVPGAHPASREEGVPAAPLTLGTYRDIWAGPITELNPPLKFLQPQQRAELSPSDAERLGVTNGDKVKVGQNGSSVLALVQIRERVQEGVCFLIEGTADGNANQLLNGGPVAVEISRVPTPSPAVAAEEPV